jgi:hypothetical protein
LCTLCILSVVRDLLSNPDPKTTKPEMLLTSLAGVDENKQNFRELFIDHQTSAIYAFLLRAGRSNRWRKSPDLCSTTNTKTA